MGASNALINDSPRCKRRGKKRKGRFGARARYGVPSLCGREVNYAYNYYM